MATHKLDFFDSGLPPGTKLKEGDVLIIKTKVKYDFQHGDPDAGYLFVKTDGAVKPADVLMLWSRRWHHGDNVRVKQPRCGAEFGDATVIATDPDSDEVWIKFSKGGSGLVPSRALIPIPDDPEPLLDAPIPAAPSSDQESPI